MRLLVAVLVLVLIAPPVAAHIGNPTSSTVLYMADFKLAIAPAPDPVLIDTPTRFTLVDVAPVEGRVPQNPKLRLLTDDGVEAEYAFAPEDTVWRTEPVLFTTIEAVHADVFLDDPNGSRSAFSFGVYRALGFDIAPIDGTADPVANKPYRLVFRTSDPETAQPTDALNDLNATIFPKGTEPLDGDLSELVTFTETDNATWAAQHTFPVAGTWIMRLASNSGGFGSTETPPWQVDVLAPAEPTSKSSSGFGVVATIALLALLATSAAARSARR